MANTTNFNWETPDDTDLVKDGAAAIRTLGSAIDTSLVDLKGGTTGQVLSKATNTDMDFTWVAQDDSNAIQNAIVDAKGDIIAASANDTPARLAVGTNDHRLVAASGETTGLKYVADTQNTVVDAEGDLLVGDAADTVQRLAIGSNAQVLTVDTSVDGKIKWATPSAGASFVGCKAYNANAQNISNATVTKIAFDSEYFDTNAIHDPSSNNTRFTVPSGKDGKWQISITIAYDTNSSGFRQIRVVKNNTTFNNIILPPANGDETHFSHTDIFDLVATDYMELAAYQNSAGTLAVQGGAYTTFSFFYLGA